MENRTELTKEELEKYVREIFERPMKMEHNLVIMQGCIERGAVTRSSENLNLCDNEQCVSCMIYHNLIKEELNTNK